MLKKKLSILITAIVVLILLTALAFQLFMKHMISKFLESRIPVEAVAAQTVTYQPWGKRVEAVGTFVAQQGVQLTTQVPGVVTSIIFKSGSQVKKGDLLLTLENTQDRAALVASRANRDLAHITYKRVKSLLDEGAISQDKLDQALADFKAAQADVVAKKDMLSKKNIAAPFSGVIGIRQVNIGQYISPGSVIAPLYTLDPIYVDFTVTEDTAQNLQLGQTTQVAVDAFSGKIFSGFIMGRNPQSDVDTHTVLFRASIRNADNLLFPGLFGRVTIDYAKQERYLTLPKSAITYAPYGQMVYVLKQDPDTTKKLQSQGQKEAIFIAEQKFVKVGQERDNIVVIESGLQEGDLVVTAGQIKIKNKSHVFLSKDADALGQSSPDVIL